MCVSRSRFKWWELWVMLLIGVIILMRFISSEPAKQPVLITPTAPNSPVEYLIHVLDILQEHALYSDQISDWPALRQQALAKISDARTTADTYSQISYLVQRLNDNHSQFWPPAQAAQFTDHTGIGIFGAYVPPVVKHLTTNLGYVQLPQVITEQDFSPYVETVYTQLKQLSQPPVCGWVVDLRADQGGNMYPMLAALGPLLGNGEFGMFIDKNGGKSAWFHRKGAVGVGTTTAYQFTPPDLDVDYTTVPVAVLTGSLTNSAGEAIVISFSGRKLTRRFGSSTAGRITANVPYSLSDGAVLLLAEAREADRTGNLFVGRISPDVYVPDDMASSDNVLNAATDWLSQQCPS